MEEKSNGCLLTIMSQVSLQYTNTSITSEPDADHEFTICTINTGTICTIILASPSSYLLYVRGTTPTATVGAWAGQGSGSAMHCTI